MNDRLETLILNSLIYNKEFSGKIASLLKKEYFHDSTEKAIFSEIFDFITGFNDLPTKEALSIKLNNNQDTIEYINNKIHKPDAVNIDWLLDETEKWCKEKALYNALRESISIVDDTTGKKNKNSIPDLLSKALSFTFKPSDAHDLFDGAAERYKHLHKQESRVPFSTPIFNKITRGGLPKKTLNVVIAGTHVGKTGICCNFAAEFLSQNQNVLYITFEEGKYELTHRIEANILNMTPSEIYDLNEVQYLTKINKIRQQNRSFTEKHLKTLHYPMSHASVIEFNRDIKELKIRENFVPDVIIVDYIGVCASSRLNVANSKSYEYMKAIAQELSALGAQHNAAILTASQFNREGVKSSDPDMTNTAESMGIPHHGDFIIALISNDELKARNEIKVKQLKNRYNGTSFYNKFLLGYDRAKMKFYELEDHAQAEIDNNVEEKKEKRTDIFGNINFND